MTTFSKNFTNTIKGQNYIKGQNIFENENFLFAVNKILLYYSNGNSISTNQK